MARKTSKINTQRKKTAKTKRDEKILKMQDKKDLEILEKEKAEKSVEMVLYQDAETSKNEVTYFMNRPKKENRKKEPREYEDWVENDLSDEEYDKLLSSGDVVKTFPDHYKQEYDRIAYEAMCEENATLSKVCVALCVSRSTLNKWLRRHPTLRIAIDNGKQVSEELFRDKLSEYAFKPSGLVNNSLIKLLARNVYDISEEPQVVINNQSNNNAIVAPETSTLYQEAVEKLKKK